jgi:hypothetical protein
MSTDDHHSLISNRNHGYGHRHRPARTNLFGGTGVGTLLGNVTIIPAVVTSFVSSRLGTVGRDVPHLAAIEAAPVLRTSLVNDMTSIALEARVGAIPRNMTSL